MDANLVQQQGLSSTDHALRVENERLLEQQTSETDQRTTNTVGHPPQLVCGRHLDTGPNGTTNNGTSKQDCATPHRTGHSDQPEEVLQPTSTDCNLPGTHRGSESEQDQTTNAQSTGSSENNQPQA